MATPEPETVRINRFAQKLFEPLPDRYDRLAEVFSLGQNGRWRGAMVDRVLEANPKLCLDVATGTAGVALRIAQKSSALVIGLDLTPQMLLHGQARVNQLGLGDRIRLILGRAEQLPFPDASFDAVAFTYLLRYVADPADTLKEIARVVRPGGRLSSLEFHVPRNPLWRLAWWIYTRILLPATGRLAGDGWHEVGKFLGPSISDHNRRFPLDWHIRAWRQAGMVGVGFRIMSLGGGLVMWGTKAGG
jgi:demethylmenaquinone methyltransferase/2-methoxy-6-polyprenyl-1,4-benzoquinol methylase